MMAEKSDGRRMSRPSPPLQGPRAGAPPKRFRRNCLLSVATAAAALLGVSCARETPRGTAEAPPPAPRGGKALVIFAGAASQPATMEAVALYKRLYGVPVECTFGGSGAVLNQVRMEQYGDIYLPGSNEYMDVAEKDGLVLPKTRRVICRLAPAICVASGNPLGIRGVADLARPGLRLTIGDPGSVCLGRIAVDAFRRAGISDKVRSNIVTYASDCQQIINLIRLGEVDAAVGYAVFGRQSPDLLDVILIEGGAAVNIPAAVIVYSKRPQEAQRLVDFLAGPQGKEIFRKHGYTIDNP